MIRNVLVKYFVVFLFFVMILCVFFRFVYSIGLFGLIFNC